MKSSMITAKSLGHAVDAYVDMLCTQVSLGQLSVNTLPVYRSKIHFFCSTVGPQKIMSKITSDDVDEAMRVYATSVDRRYRRCDVSGKSETSQILFSAVLLRFFIYAQQQRWVTSSPVDGSKLLTRISVRSENHVNPKLAVLSLDQCQRLIDASATLSDVEAINQRNRALLTTMCILGPRLSEVISMDASVIGQSEWRIVGWGGRVRQVPLPPALAVVLRQWRTSYDVAVQAGEIASVDTQAMFVGLRGKRVLECSVQDMLNEAADAAKLDRGVTPQTLRHTSATLMLASGWDIKVVGQMLGHRQLSTMKRYLDDISDELKASVVSHPLAQMLGQMD